MFQHDKFMILPFQDHILMKSMHSILSTYDRINLQRETFSALNRQQLQQIENTLQMWAIYT